ncbi:MULTISPECIES: beta-ketoacyl-ACP synthase III [Devosia]|uniref:Beta-ketoacyl-[acyl-carrier-protein] synthase III n=1 Tax=Devosia equisanguinis TaxID=2490941 RepID=A0A3S4GMZ5_9HYPH|nr:MULTISPECIES: beta-ketoacyl-ACP synthase III [Devosia]ODT47004.1 MAG: 3-oxoacyl-ACP synthase [Pelagibacterium sp. SCN 63-126]ODU88817.1 MAG: 3-oxoacyl-ACP synthase [Pelagibacterium sp. SCN 63-17]OJX43285.1 MAG: 3-oxoacyl-ACP synthase [Devosia sp. 63-57]VDS06794.1 3-oxoacyl-[acyl-carrier-protein] synthase 3 [Devosia equisanguinis]
MTRTRSVIRGVGSYLPANVVSNAELAKTVDTSDEWIQQRVGIKQRHIAAEGEFTSDLAVAAGRAALENAGLTPDDIDLIIVATTTPDYTFPAAATLVQMKLGMSHGFAFDIQAVCSGFVYAVTTADSYIKNGLANRVLVIGAETFSRLLDWTDRTTCVLFGDGAGAVVLERVELAEGEPERGIIASALRSDGKHWDKLYVDGGPSTTGTTGHVHMQGPEVFRHAVGKITDVVYSALEKSGHTVADLDWFVPHQANRRIIEGAGAKLGLPPEKVVMTVEQHANTSAASVPLALSVAVADGRIKPGDLVMLEAMGGGFTWGASLIRW